MQDLPPPDPGLTVQGDTNTGLYAPAPDQLAVITAEVKSLQETLAARDIQISELQAQVAAGGPAQ